MFLVLMLVKVDAEIKLASPPSRMASNSAKSKTYILVKFNTLTVRSEEPHQVNERTLCYRACSVAYHRWRQNELRTKKVAREAQQMDKIHVNPLAPKSD